jgi:hypothetical protein
MRSIIILLLFVSALGCEKDSENQFCWRCEKKATIYYDNCGTVTTRNTLEFEILCYLTENEASDYENKWVADTTITGSMDSTPCDYVKITTYYKSVICSKLGREN